MIIIIALLLIIGGSISMLLTHSILDSQSSAHLIQLYAYEKLIIMVGLGILLGDTLLRI